MAKLIAILNVIAWGGFWSFGYLAVGAGTGVTNQTTIAVILAVIGAACGLWCWLWLVRHSEQIGYAKPANRVFKTDEEMV